MSSRTLVTGAAGFIGRAVSEALVQHGSRVSALITPGGQPPRGVHATYSFRLPDPQLGPLLAELRPELIMHCAGTASVGGSFVDPVRDFADTVVITEHLLASIATHSPTTRVVLLSSAAVLGEPAEQPASETTSTGPISPYGFHKLMCETLCAEYFSLWGVPTVVARPFSVYGPGLRRQLLWDVYQKWLTSDTIQLDGDGEETRDFVYIDDLVRALLTIAEQSAFRAECIHIGTGEAVTVRSMATALMAALGTPKPIHFSGHRRVGDPRRWQADNRRLQALGMHTWTPVDAGVRQYAEWVRAR